MHPVHADYAGNGDFTSTGIAFEDYARMTTQQHKLAAHRHGPAPDWVFNNTKLRAVIVGCVEARAYMNGSPYRHDTDAERLARAQQKLATDKPNLEERIDELCKQYMAAKRAGDAGQTKFFAQKVEEVDTQLRLIENPAKYYAGVAYHYWRSGLNSVETGQQLGMKPPHVRALLWRMGKVAGQLGYGAPKNKQPSGAERSKRKQQQVNGRLHGRPSLALDIPKAVAMYRAGKSWTDIAEAMGYPRGKGQCRCKCVLKRKGLL